MINILLCRMLRPSLNFSSRSLLVLIKNSFYDFQQISLQKHITRGEDILDYMSHQEVVYKISCHDCDATYVRQTKRHLKTRINEHTNDINKRTLLR